MEEIELKRKEKEEEDEEEEDEEEEDEEEEVGEEEQKKGRKIVPILEILTNFQFEANQMPVSHPLLKLLFLSTI